MLPVRCFVVLACALTLLAPVGQAREEKQPAAPKELVLSIPANSELYLSFRVAAIWKSPLLKQLLAELGKEVQLFQELKLTERELGISPEQITRVTIVSTDLKASLDSRMPPTLLLETSKPMDTRSLLRLGLLDAKPRLIHGQTVLVAGQQAGLFRADRQLALIGPLPTIEAMLDPKAPKPSGLLAQVIAQAATEHAVGYVVPKVFVEQAERELKLMGFWFVVRPLLATQQAAVWVSIGYESKGQGHLQFTDEKAAQRAFKVIQAMQTLAAVSLENLRPSLQGKWQAASKFLARVEKILEEAPLEHKGKSVSAQWTLKLGKAEMARLLKEAVIPLRQAARKAQMSNHLKQIGLALHNYHDSYGTFPAAASYDKDGKPLLSWRVHLLPFLEQEALYRQFKLDEPWDSPHNKKLLAKMPAVYALPGVRPKIEGGTVMQGFVGKGAFFEGKRGLRLSDITDGTSNTFMIVEAGQEVPWTKPEDLPFDPKAKQLPQLGGTFEDGFAVVFGDGSVRFIKHTTKLETLKAYITRNGGEVIQGDE
jgi:hypothetical protein